MIQSDGGRGWRIFDAPSICFYGGCIVLFPRISPTSPCRPVSGTALFNVTSGRENPKAGSGGLVGEMSEGMRHP